MPSLCQSPAKIRVHLSRHSNWIYRAGDNALLANVPIFPEQLAEASNPHVVLHDLDQRARDEGVIYGDRLGHEDLVFVHETTP